MASTRRRTYAIFDTSNFRLIGVDQAPVRSVVESMNRTTAIILTFFISFASIVFGQGSDALLRRVMNADRADRTSAGSLPVLTADEHLSRADAYMENRLFPQAREHWKIVIDNFPDDPGIPRALFGTARSYMWERDYQKAVDWFDRLIKDHLMTKEGRDGLAYEGASYVRMGKNLEAVDAYTKYTVMFPEGEKIESAYLNIIDAYREAGQFDDANLWVDKTAARFKGAPSEVNALHARLRMEIFRENWKGAVPAADQLLGGLSFRGSMASADEVRYLKGFAEQQLGNKKAAADAFAGLSGDRTSYFSQLRRSELDPNGRSARRGSAADYQNYPVVFRDLILQNARARDLDPRFMLAIMRQESAYRPTAKSPAGARGLLQLVFDTAIKYKDAAGYPDLKPDDLYDPATNIAVGSEYIKFLKQEFGGMYEGIAASYNGGEDNALRWLNRSNPKKAGIFTSEIGFAESKNYVFKVMANYWIYCDLYTKNLDRR